MVQPEGFKDETNRVIILKKTLYGLKQSPREFNKLKDGYFINADRFNLVRSTPNKAKA